MNHVSRSPRSLWFVVPLLATAILVSCGHKERTVSDVENARATLEHQLQFAERNESPFFVKHITIALKKLDRLPGGRLTTPMPIYGYIDERTRDQSTQHALVLGWVEEDFDVSGFYLLDEAGNATDCPASLSIGKELLGGSVFRNYWVPVVTDPSDKSWQDDESELEPGEPILLRGLDFLDFREGKIRVGLMTKAGREEPTLVVGYQRASARTPVEGEHPQEQVRRVDEADSGDEGENGTFTNM